MASSMPAPRELPVSVIKRFAELEVLVLGDAVLDSYLKGASERLSREAPIPVVEIQEHEHVPGGAANTAVNVASLGARVRFLSVVGADREAELLSEALAARKVVCDHLLKQPGRKTIAKRRLACSGQIVARFDEGSTEPITGQAEDQLIARLRELFEAACAVIISDYACGVLTPRVIHTLAELQAQSPRVLVVDAKHLPPYRPVGITAVKPNYREALKLLNLSPADDWRTARADHVAEHGERILDITSARIAAVTLDSEGALIFERGSSPYRTYARPTPNPQTIGAGDTFASTLALALAAGADTPTAAELASAAASIVVHKEGTAACTAYELHEYISAQDKYLRAEEHLRACVELYRAQGRRIVFTNGCFDLLHSGHISYLNQAKALGDVLIVGINGDASVARLKGPGRPINSLEERVQVLSALSCIDQIVSFEGDTSAELVRTIRPDIFVKGGDYTQETLPEAPLIRELGGTVEILPYISDHSTTRIIERIRQPQPKPKHRPSPARRPSQAEPYELYPLRLQARRKHRTG